MLFVSRKAISVCPIPSLVIYVIAETGSIRAQNADPVELTFLLSRVMGSCGAYLAAPGTTHWPPPLSHFRTGLLAPDSALCRAPWHGTPMMWRRFSTHRGQALPIRVLLVTCTQQFVGIVSQLPATPSLRGQSRRDLGRWPSSTVTRCCGPPCAGRQ